LVSALALCISMYLPSHRTSLATEAPPSPGVIFDYGMEEEFPIVSAVTGDMATDVSAVLIESRVSSDLPP
jgi:hypothetical protein